MASRKQKVKDESEAGPSRKRAKLNNGGARASNVISDEEEDNKDDLDLSQRPDFVPPSNVKNEPDAGIIEKVSLKNFMCHSKLEVGFQPQVNFVIGRNGSGKSAILTALVVGLGGKANVTNRGGNVKEFIKKGKHTSEVTVKLRNQGPDAYKPELYGKSIVVERKLSQEGGGYKLKSQDGKVVSTKREELSHILDQLNIQVDNPISLLNQDTSRNFLNSKSPQDKYRFFLKATQLEQMRTDYIEANEEKEMAEEIMRQKDETLPALQKDVWEWEQKYKAVISLEDLKQKVTKLKNEMAWAFVYEQERVVQDADKELKMINLSTPKYQQKVDDSKNRLDAVMKRKKTIEEELKKLNEEVNQIEPEYNEAKKDYKDTKNKVKGIEIAEKKVKSEIASKERDKKEIEKRIHEITTTAQTDYEAQRQARETRIADLEQKIQEYSAERKTTEQQIEQFKSAVMKYKNDLYKLKQEEDNWRSQKDQTRRYVRELESSRKDKMNRFGEHIPVLIQRIKDATRRGVFHEEPIGPVGAHIELREQRWALAVESCLKGLIHSFCVTDHHDEKELQNIMAQVYPEGRNKPSVITAKFLNSVHDVTRGRAQTDQYSTVLDMLVIKDPVIANCLIDQSSVESILLIDNQDEAMDIMMKNSIPNGRQAFTLRGDQMFGQPTFRYYAASEDNARYLTANVEDDIRRLHAQVREYEQGEKDVQGRRKQMESDIRNNTNEERRHTTRVTKINSDINNMLYEVRELKSHEDPAPADVTTLETEVALIEESIREKQEELVEASRRLADIKQKVDNTKKIFEDLQARMNKVTDTFEPLKEDMASSDGEIQSAKERKAHYEKKMKEHLTQVTARQAVYDKHAEKLQADTDKASQICEKIKTRRTADNIGREILQIEKRIEQEERNKGSIDEITKKYHDMLESFKHVKKEVGRICNFLNAFDNIMKKRQDQFAEFRKFIALRAKYFFILLLNNRNYSGGMTFNHKKEILEMNVQPHAVGGQGTKDLKSLSGGERSFSTVCFILSLWDTIESPFRCLDEFDVFMDMVNRRVAMDMMLNVAESQKSRQFVFLTPQDMSHLDAKNYVHIFLMPTPERGQRQIDFPPANQNQDDNDENED